MQSIPEPKVVATILNYNRWLDTIECVQSLQNCLYPSLEIILIDNGSPDGSFEQLKKAFPNIDVISTGKNLGYAAGVNVSLAFAQAKNPKYILVLNNDTVVEPNFLDHLVETMEQNGNAAAACGTIYCHHERTKIWYGGGRLISWRGIAIHEQKGLVVEPSSLNGTRKVSFVTGCMILFRAKFLDRIGLIDERFFMYLDDIEFSARILAKGYDLLYVPKAIIYHKVLGEKESAFKLYYSVRNRLLLIKTAFRGFSGFIAERYFLTVIILKLFIWRFTNPLFFKAASYGLKDFFAGKFYEGRGIAEFAMNQYIPKQDSPAPFVVAIVLNWNGYEDTIKCVQSLKQSSYANLKIIIVDNGSTDGSTEKLERAFSDLTVIKLPQNGGYAAGNNAGIRFALEQKAEYVLVLNNDVVVEKGFLQPMVEIAERDQTIGIVTCKVNYQSELSRIYAAGGTFNRWLCTGINNLQGKIDNPRDDNQEREREITFVPGCAMLVRRSVFEKAGLFAENFFLYFEDLEFSRRVNKHFRLVYTPKGKIYHKCGAGQSWSSYTPTYLYYHTRNRLWVFQEDGMFYRFYVLIFTLLNVLAKSLVLLWDSWYNKASFPDNLPNKVRALWRGVKDGVGKEDVSL